MSDTKIEKGVPLPPRTAYDLRKSDARVMDVGDSMFFENEKKAQAFRVKIYQAGGRAAIRKGANGFRVWRVK